MATYDRYKSGMRSHAASRRRWLARVRREAHAVSAVRSTLTERVSGRVEFDAPLAPYTTYRIGGPAAAVVHPASVDDVAATLQLAAESETPWLALGLGSNVLIADAGFDGIVIRLVQTLEGLEQEVDRDVTCWRAGAGFPTPQLARRSAKAGLAGVHRLIGVPGTVGGGVVMNAGAHGQDFSQVVRNVTLVTPAGDVRVFAGSEVRWKYRASGLDGVVVEATVQLVPAASDQLDEEIRQHFAWRKAGTPFNEPCCGSVFRNPTAPLTPPARGGQGRPSPAHGRTAGQLIDACGLKGFRIGGAEVSTKHANYIVNGGGATAGDVLRVIEHVRGEVSRRFGIDLDLEVKVIG